MPTTDTTDATCWAIEETKVAPVSVETMIMYDHTRSETTHRSVSLEPDGRDADLPIFEGLACGPGKESISL